MNALVAQVLPLALGAAVSPTVFTAFMLVLAGKHARGRSLALLAGAALPLLAVGVLCAVVFARAPSDGHDAARSTASALIDALAGAALLGLAARQLLTGRGAGSGSKRRAGEAESGDATRAGRFFGLGIALMVTNVTTLVLFIPASKDIGRADVGTLVQAVAFALLLAVALAPLLVPETIYLIAPARAERLLQPVGDFARAHQRSIGIGVLVVFGVYLLVKGVVRL